MLGHAGIVGAETAYRSRECFPVCLMDERHGSPRTLSEDGEGIVVGIAEGIAHSAHDTRQRLLPQASRDDHATSGQSDARSLSGTPALFQSEGNL